MGKGGRLLNPTGKAKVLSPVRPNAGTAAEYRRRLDRLVGEMTASLDYWIAAAYRANEPATMAQDRSATAELNIVVKRLARRWTRRFADMANDLAGWFARSTAERADGSFQAALKKGGMTVKFKMTAAQNDAVQAVLAENVGLIKSIAARHLESVQGAVMRAVSGGQDLRALSLELQKIGGVTKRRAAFIARDQCNKATAVIVKTRQQEMGVTEATWQHSTAGKHPRPSHVAASGKRYLIADGMVLDGERVWPGTAINCRCVSRSIIPGL